MDNLVNDMKRVGVKPASPTAMEQRRVGFYRQMMLIRKFEERLQDLFARGLLFGTTHPYIGQEAVAVGVISALEEGDIIFSNHRGHGHFLAYSQDVDGLMAELMGKETGVCGGRGGSQHLHLRDFYSNGVQGGIVPIATGMAFAEKLKGSGRIAVAFLGDGTLGQGAVYESLNIASLWQLPILYVVENNLYAMSTHVSAAVAGCLSDRGRAFGIDSSEMMTNDVEEINAKSSEIVGLVRQRSKPYFLVIHTYRLAGHSKGDDRSYRPREEEEQWARKDPLLIQGARLQERDKVEIAQQCQELVEEAVSRALKAGFPPAPSLLE